jgi:membrane protein YqaA with SNARE-associated domain
MCHSDSSSAEASSSSTPEPASKTRRLIGGIAAILGAIAITVVLILLRDRVAEFRVVGYPAIFVMSLVGNATIILPAPSIAVVFGLGAALNPVLVGIIAGLGSALGELTGYLAGVGGRIAVEDRELYDRIERWMRKRGMLVIFVLGLIPNPAFDVGGMIAGGLKMPLWKFVLAAWAGKGLRLVIFALSGQFIISRLPI